MNKDWEIKKLYEICEIEFGTRVVRKVDGGTIFPVYGGGGATFKMDTYNRENCLIVSRFAMSEKCTRFVEGKFFLNDSGLSLRANENVIYQKYLETVILGKNDEIYSLGRGAAQKNLDMARFRELKISYPKSLEEQKRIVKILDEKIAQLETIKTNAQTNLQNAKDLFQSQLTRAFSNTTWEKKRLGDCGTFKNGMNFAATDSGYTIRSLGVGDFKERYSIDNTEILSEISLKAAPSEDYLLHDGDIVFVRSNGNKELVGRCLLVYPKDIPTTYSGFCIRFRKDFDLLDADFLLHFMKAESSRKILNGKEGANISNLNQKILSDFEVPLPPLPEQKHIVKELDTLNEKVKALQNIYEQMLLDCEELKQSFLCKAFAGEL